MIRLTSQPKIFFLFAGSLVIALLALYWPVLRADFAWDELLDSLTSISAHSNHLWEPLLRGQTNGYATYFRPLVMILFSLELRAFAFQPGPMHAVSLAIHALNVVLVGLLAMRLAELSLGRRSWRDAVLPMLIYGVHPLLIEPVSWIGCQYDLAMTTFTLLALLVNIRIVTPRWRAVTIGLCFFLAACCKESAVSFPLVLLTLDWLLLDRAAGKTATARLRTLIKANGTVYLAVCMAGIAYLVFRYHGLGHLLSGAEVTALGAFGRFQQVSYLLVHYLRMLIWPMTGLSPIHPVGLEQFHRFDMAAMAIDIAAIAIVMTAVVLTLRRQPVGALMLVAIFSLLPVLHIIPIKFDASLYHERYAMTALALACCMLPLAFAQGAPLVRRRPLLRMAAFGTLFFWIAASVANVRATVPLWSSDLLRWQWAYLEYPQSTQAQESLLAAYVDHRAYGAARKMVDELLDRRPACLICVVHAAGEAVATHQSALAGMLLDRLDDSGLYRGSEVTLGYLTIRKRVATDEGDSVALRMSFGMLGDGRADGAPANGMQKVFVFESHAPASPLDTLLAFAQSQHREDHAPRPALIASFPLVAGTSIIAL